MTALSMPTLTQIKDVAESGPLSPKLDLLRRALAAMAEESEVDRFVTLSRIFAKASPEAAQAALAVLAED